MWGCGLEFRFCSKRRPPFWASLVDLPQKLLSPRCPALTRPVFVPSFSMAPSEALPLALHPTVLQSRPAVFAAGAEAWGGLVPGLSFLGGEGSRLDACSVQFSFCPLAFVCLPSNLTVAWLEMERGHFGSLIKGDKESDYHSTSAGSFLGLSYWYVVYSEGSNTPCPTRAFRTPLGVSILIFPFLYASSFSFSHLWGVQLATF